MHKWTDRKNGQAKNYMPTIYRSRGIKIIVEKGENASHIQMPSYEEPNCIFYLQMVLNWTIINFCCLLKDLIVSTTVMEKQPKAWTEYCAEQSMDRCTGCC